jgi:predicted DNA-binding protein
MKTIELDDDLAAEIEQLAAIEHKPVKQIVNECLRELIEDYQDARAAESAIARIESGDDKLVSWSDVKATLTQDFPNDDFFMCAGMWKEANINQESIRSKAWTRNIHDSV